MIERYGFAKRYVCRPAGTCLPKLLTRQKTRPLAPTHVFPTPMPLPVRLGARLRRAIPAALGAVLAVGSASAQSLQPSLALAPASADHAIIDLEPAANAATTSIAAACTPSQALDQAAGATFVQAIAPAGPAYGQSFTAPCDGTLTQVGLSIQFPTGSEGARVYGVLQVYSGAGTGGALVASQPFAIANPAGNFFTVYPLQISAPVTTGGVYTFFLRTTSQSTAVRGTASGTAGPYAGGQMYRSPDGTAAAAVAVPASDLSFQLTFNGATASQASAFNGAGWRLLSLPVIGTPLQELSKLNLVQGFISQYPNAGGNVLQNYTGTGTGAGFTVASPPVPAAAAYGPGLGRGFFWYFYDQDSTPDSTGAGGGTSRSRELTGFTLTASGRARTSPFASTQPQLNADGLYMLGNPFPAATAVDDIIINAAPGGPFGTLGTTFSVWDPAIVNYRPLFVENPTTMATDYLAVWQGVFAQVTGGTAAPQFAFYPSPAPTTPPPFYGRTTPTPYVQLMLDGTTTGAQTHDVAAYVRFTPGGLATWDADDASKLAMPPGVESALLAPVGVDEFGTRARLAVNSFPAATTGMVTVPVDFRSTVGGSFVISWAGADALPEGWSATLIDAVENTTTDLRQTPSYAFTSDVTDWTERFTLTVLPRGATAGEAAPTALRVGTFAPNPAMGVSRLTFTSDVAQTVRATVVDALGREVVVLFDAAVAAGTETSLSVEAGRLAPGTYVVRIAGDTFSETRRLTVVR